MNTTHTPGPWSFNCEENNGWKGRTFSVQVSAGETLIANYDTSYVEYPESNDTNAANARLIAAAPELLAQLSEAFYSVGKSELKDIYGTEWYEATQAAIAKATGEQP